MAKTTLELTDSLLIKAKKMAAELRRPLRSIVEAALRSYLRDLSPSRNRKTKLKQIRWKTVEGGAPEGLDVSNREKMHEWLRR